jgi:hypothetical protein
LLVLCVVCQCWAVSSAAREEYLRVAAGRNRADCADELRLDARGRLLWVHAHTLRVHIAAALRRDGRDECMEVGAALGDKAPISYVY